MPDSKKHSQPIPNPKGQSRRRAVKTIVGGVTAFAAYNVLPAKWGAPFIESVFIPAYALTSGFSLSDPCSVEITEGDNTTDSITVKVTGFVAPPIASLPTTITVTATGGSGQTAQTTTVTSENGTFEASITIGGGPGITKVDAVTTVQGASGSASCSVSTLSGAGSAPTSPTATTNAASSIGNTGGTLNGTVNANSASTTVTFEYGTTVAYGTTVTADQSPVTGSTDTAVSNAIMGLTPGTAYHYRVVAQNAYGTTYGINQSFNTI